MQAGVRAAGILRCPPASRLPARTHSFFSQPWSVRAISAAAKAAQAAQAAQRRRDRAAQEGKDRGGNTAAVDKAGKELMRVLETPNIQEALDAHGTSKTARPAAHALADSAHRKMLAAIIKEKNVTAAAKKTIYLHEEN